MSRIDGELLSVNFKEGETVQKGQLLAKIDGTVYRLQLQEAQSRLAWEKRQFSDGVSNRTDTVEVDQAELELAQRRLADADITAPVSGVAGFRLVDAGNFIHAGQPLVVIVQPQPVAVIFTIPQDGLPVILQRLKAGDAPVVEVWDRSSSKKIASGRLGAADNQIDPATGTVKLKATFDNKDGALFPNQIVTVRCFLKP
jgi:multidrug efflux system membrane fusion protein